MSDVLLRLDDVGFWRGRDCLFQGVSLSLSRGDMVALIGENGVGKSSLFSLLLKGGDGIFFANGAKVVLVGDRPALYMDWSVGVFLSWCAQREGFSQDRAWQVAKQCGLEKVWTRLCSALSYGFRQRVSLARALLMSPDVLLLDEPSNGLDFEKRLLLREILSFEAQERATLFVEHDLALVRDLADRIYDLRTDGLREILPPKGVFDLWVEWQDTPFYEEDALFFANFSYYSFADARLRVEKMRLLTQKTQILAMGFVCPVAVLQFLRGNCGAC